MKEIEKLTFEKIPEAISQILVNIAEIKDYLIKQTIYIKEKNSHCTENDIYTVNDVCEKLDLKKSCIYNLTHLRKIPFYKRGGRIYFDRKEINDWVKSKRRYTIEEINIEANEAIAGN